MTFIARRMFRNAGLTLGLALALLAGVPAAGQSDVEQENHALEVGAGVPDGPATEAFTSGPFGNTIRFGFGGSTSFIEIPHSPALNPTSGFTFEAWVQQLTAGNCPTIAGKGFLTAWWVGICNGELRSYLRGGGTSFTDGAVSLGVWHHVAVTWDGQKVKHYVDGALTGEKSQTDPPTTNTTALRIGRDADWSTVPDARVDEVRLWNRARNKAEIYQGMRYAIRSPQSGLVAVWSFDDVSSAAAMARDEVGPHDGSGVNTPLFFSDTGNPVLTVPDPPGGEWLTTSEVPGGFQFKVRITSGATERIGTKVNDCVPETLCIAGAIADRSEIFLRIIGPRPNGFLWAQGPRFTISQVEVWIWDSVFDQINYYNLDAVSPDADEIPGFNDRFAFLP